MLFLIFLQLRNCSEIESVPNPIYGWEGLGRRLGGVCLPPNIKDCGAGWPEASGGGSCWHVRGRAAVAPRGRDLLKKPR